MCLKGLTNGIDAREDAGEKIAGGRRAGHRGGAIAGTDALGRRKGPPVESLERLAGTGGQRDEPSIVGVVVCDEVTVELGVVLGVVVVGLVVGVVAAEGLRDDPCLLY